MMDRKMPRMADQEFPERSQGGCLVGQELQEQCFLKKQVFISFSGTDMFLKKISMKSVS